eukprot:m.18858 g.18858  ORF g.18858 m.18858 type:complete len:54 (+) comp9768_c0_seq1:2447-2608(+)
MGSDLTALQSHLAAINTLPQIIVPEMQETESRLIELNIITLRDPQASLRDPEY